MPLLYSRNPNVDAHPLNAIDFIHTEYTVTCRILSFLNYDMALWEFRHLFSNESYITEHFDLTKVGDTIFQYLNTTIERGQIFQFLF